MATEKYVWKWPDLTVSELRRFIERDEGRCLVNALRDVSVALGVMTPNDFWRPTSVWLGRVERLATIPGEIKRKLLHIDDVRIVASRHAFPSLDRMELDIVKNEIAEVMTWLRMEFPAAGVERLPDDFGS